MRLLADDLTGALDAAALFARPDAPLDVAIAHADGAGWPDAAAVLSSGTRELPAERAVARVVALLGGIAHGQPAFKKIDSLLRGNTVPEIAACAAAGIFPRLVVAPAFPAQGRRLVHGRLLVQEAGACRDGPDLMAALTAAGQHPIAVAAGGVLPERGLLVCDTETEADMAALVAQATPGTLWVGSAGLARMLAGAPAMVTVPQARPVLVIAGSPHPVLRAQVECAGNRMPDAWIRVEQPSDIAAAAARTMERLRAGLSAVLHFAPPPMAPAAARMALAGLLEAMAQGPVPGLVLVSGGDTLALLCEALGCARLEVFGEAVPGLPLGRFAQGAWRGVALIGKSGAFDDGGLLDRILTEE